MQQNLLIVDDDEELVLLLKDYLVQEGFNVTTAFNGQDALDYLGHHNHGISLVILDVMLPDMKGTDILHKIRIDNQIPIIMLTAKGDDIDRIIGLELGADDYVTKPCTPRELIARVRAILRRTVIKPEDTQSNTIKIGDLEIWPTRRLAKLKEKDLSLTSTEFNLLEALAQNAGKTVNKNELSIQCLGRHLVQYDRSIDVHMSSIRNKLGKLNDGRSYIQTVRGLGYVLIIESP